MGSVSYFVDFVFTRSEQEGGGVTVPGSDAFRLLTPRFCGIFKPTRQVYGLCAILAIIAMIAVIAGIATNSEDSAIGGYNHRQNLGIGRKRAALLEALNPLLPTSA
jgi:hypothetical protein